MIESQPPSCIHRQWVIQPGPHRPGGHSEHGILLNNTTISTCLAILSHVAGRTVTEPGQTVAGCPIGATALGAAATSPSAWRTRGGAVGASPAGRTATFSGDVVTAGHERVVGTRVIWKLAIFWRCRAKTNYWDYSRRWHCSRRHISRLGTACRISFLSSRRHTYRHPSHCHKQHHWNKYKSPDSRLRIFLIHRLKPLMFVQSPPISYADHILFPFSQAGRCIPRCCGHSAFRFHSHIGGNIPGRARIHQLDSHNSHGRRIRRGSSSHRWCQSIRVGIHRCR